MIFERNLERFLLFVIIEDDEIAELIADFGGESWEDTGLGVELKGRLLRFYEFFSDTINDIQNNHNCSKKNLG